MLNLKPTKNTTAANTYEGNNVMNIRGLRKQNLPYVFIWVVYCSWAVAFVTWWTTSPLMENVFGTELRSLMYSINLVSSGVFIFIIRKEWFVKTARSGAVLIVAGLILFLISSNATVQLIAAIVIGISFGCMNTSILLPFVFVLNNTEKLYAVVGSNAFINIILLFRVGNAASYLKNNYILLLCFAHIAIALGATLFFKKRSILKEDDVGQPINCPKFHSRIYLTLFFNCIFVILCKGVGKGIFNIAAGRSSEPVFMWYYIGGLAGCVVYIAIYAFSSKAFVWLGNITFGSFAMGILCNAFTEKVPGMVVAFAILLGIGGTVGMINMYYIIGVVGKKYNSMRYIKLAVLFIGICGGVSGMFLGNMIQRMNTLEISMIASMVSVAIMLSFLMISPLVSQSDYYDDWAKDSGKTEIDNEQLHIFKKYGLSKRETQVCKLLLQGYTMRQISGILSISYPTVNTYCTSCYRKIGINSRTELLILLKDFSIK